MQRVKQAIDKSLHQVLQPEFQQFHQGRTVPIFVNPAAYLEFKIYVPGQYNGEQSHHRTFAQYLNCSYEVKLNKSV